MPEIGIRRISLLMAIAMLGYGGWGRADTQPFRVQLNWENDSPVPCPVYMDIPEGIDTGEGLILVRLADAVSLPVPIQHDPEFPRRIWWLAGPPPVGLAVMTYELRRGEPSRVEGTVVEAEQDDKNLTISISGKPVLVYRHAPVSPPEGRNPLYTRSGFIHPLYSPAGQILTAIHPPDHIHHLGIWNPWTSTEFRGQHVDFWNLGKGQGTVRFVRFLEIGGGPVFGGFRALQEHVAFTRERHEMVVLNEIRQVRVWNISGAFLIDVVSTQTCVSDEPLKLNAYRYGGFGFRGRPGWGSTNSDYLTSEGKTRADGHGTRARWCHAYGTSDEGPAGILFLSHPENREHPEPVRLWPADMNRGRDNMFFNFCPVQKKPWLLEPGRSYCRRYRMYVYDGEPSAEKAEQLWQNFARTPQLEFQPAGSEP